MDFNRLYIGRDGAYGVRIDQHGHGEFFQLVDYLLNGPKTVGPGELKRRDPGPEVWYLTTSQCFLLTWLSDVVTDEQRQSFTQYLPRALNPSAPLDDLRHASLVLQCAEGLMSYAGAAESGWYEDSYRHLRKGRGQTDAMSILSCLRMFMRALLHSRHGTSSWRVRDAELKAEIETYVDLILPEPPAEFSERNKQYLGELLALQAKSSS
jgi:hypothetical protein